MEQLRQTSRLLQPERVFQTPRWVPARLSQIFRPRVLELHQTLARELQKLPSRVPVLRRVTALLVLQMPRWGREQEHQKENFVRPGRRQRVPALAPAVIQK